MNAGASVRSKALVGSHARRYTVTAEGARSRPAAERAIPPELWNVRVRASATASRRAQDPGLCAGQEQRAGRREGLQALVQRDAARRRARRRIAAYSAVGRASARIIRTARRPSCARRSARAYGLDPARIVCGAGSDDLLNLLARAYLQDGDEAIHTTHGFLVYPIATLGAGATPVVAPGEGVHRRRRCDPRQGDADAPRSCSWPTRTIRPAPTFRSTR